MIVKFINIMEIIKLVVQNVIKINQFLKIENNVLSSVKKMKFKFMVTLLH